MTLSWSLLSREKSDCNQDQEPSTTSGWIACIFHRQLPSPAPAPARDRQDFVDCTGPWHWDWQHFRALFRDASLEASTEQPVFPGFQQELFKEAYRLYQRLGPFQVVNEFRESNYGANLWDSWRMMEVCFVFFGCWGCFSHRWRCKMHQNACPTAGKLQGGEEPTAGCPGMSERDWLGNYTEPFPEIHFWGSISMANRWHRSTRS